MFLFIQEKIRLLSVLLWGKKIHLSGFCHKLVAKKQDYFFYIPISKFIPVYHLEQWYSKRKLLAPSEKILTKEGVWVKFLSYSIAHKLMHRKQFF